MSKEKKSMRNLSSEELSSKASELEATIFKLRIQKATGQLSNTAKIRATRKELARVKTAQTEGRVMLPRIEK